MKYRDKKQTRKNGLKWCQMKMTLVNLKYFFFFFLVIFGMGQEKFFLTMQFMPVMNIFLGENLSYTDWKDIIEK